jgi:hypothetical protein
MTTSGSTDFELNVADYVEEAFERCGLEVRTGYDLQTTRRSLNILFADWANRGLVAPLGKDLIPIKATGQVGNVTVVV